MLPVISRKFPVIYGGERIWCNARISPECSPDGRVLGKMGHSERCGEYVHINIPGNKEQQIFKAGVRYFTGEK